MVEEGVLHDMPGGGMRTQLPSGSKDLRNMLLAVSAAVWDLSTAGTQHSLQCAVQHSATVCVSCSSTAFCKRSLRCMGESLADKAVGAAYVEAPDLTC